MPPTPQHLTTQQLTQLKAVFDEIDTDSTGTISSSEFQRVMKSLGLHATDDEVRDIIKDIDLNRDGQIDFLEFLRVMSHPETHEALDPSGNPKDLNKEQRELRAAFKVFDRDGSGTISPEELRAALRQLGEAYTDDEINEMISHADLDGNGSIDYNEFVDLMQAQKH